MRIVGGRHRGRPLQSPDSGAVRPTSDRARESLFNILEHGKLATAGLSPVREAIVLDCFCGTGALGLEALSRGAASAVFIDSDSTALKLARSNAQSLGDTGRSQFLQADARKPPPAPTPSTLIFLDPPYGEDLATPTLEALANAGWFAPQAIVVIETGLRDIITAPPGFEAVDERRYGKAKLTFLRRR